MAFVSGSATRRGIIGFSLLLIALVAIAGSFLLDVPVQRTVLAAYQGHWNHEASVAASSKYGDWPELMAAGILGFFVARRLRSVRWQRILLSAMIASTLAIGYTVRARSGESRSSLLESIPAAVDMVLSA